MESPTIQCPNCKSEALYRYGKTHNGKKRYLCQVCDRQFIRDSKKLDVKKRPSCHVCGAAMHVYMRKGNLIRFRCSCFPECRTYMKSEIEVMDKQ